MNDSHVICLASYKLLLHILWLWLPLQCIALLCLYAR